MFFTHIHQMMTEGVDLTLSMRKSSDGRMTVSLMPKSQSLKDGAQNHLIPLTLSGTPAELDAGFFQAAMQPVQRVTGLIANMAAFEKQADKAASDSKSSKAAKDKESKEAKEKREKYDKSLKKAEEQLAAKNYAEALQSFQQARLYATKEQVAKVDEKIAAVKSAQSQGSLFEVPAAPPAPAAEPIAPAQSVQPAQQPVPQAAPVQAAAPISQAAAPGGIPVHPAAQPQNIPPRPQPGQPQYAPHPAGGYPQQPLPPMPQYGQQYSGGDSLGMPAYDNPDNPPTYRPEEYAGYVDFPQGMVAPAPQGATQYGNM